MMETFFEEETISYARVSGTVSKLLEAMATQFHYQLSCTPQMQYTVTVYDSHTVPDIQLADYLYRITSMSKCIYRDFVTALVYVDKLINNEVISGISFHNVHRLLALSIMTSTKFYDDMPYSNKAWSKILGIPLRELNNAEIHFLQSLNYDLNVDIETMQAWANDIARFSEEIPVQQEREETPEIKHRDQNCSEPNAIAAELRSSPVAL